MEEAMRQKRLLKAVDVKGLNGISGLSFWTRLWKFKRGK